MGTKPTNLLKEPLITRAAQSDIASIWRYISEDSKRHADLVEEAIMLTCYLVARLPGIGHMRLDLKGHNILFLAVKNYRRYTISYLRDSEPTKNLRVLHGARDVPRLFQP